MGQGMSFVRESGDGDSHTSFFSKGVPGIGTNAFTGKDSGCSGMLVETLGGPLFSIVGDALGHLVNQTDVIFRFFAEAEDATATDTDSRLPDSLHSIQTVVVRARRNDLCQD